MYSNKINIDICNYGYWLELRSAIDNIADRDKGKNIELDKRKFKKNYELNESFYFEYAKNTKVDYYKNCKFLYITKPRFRAISCLSLPLSKFCNLCKYLSDKTKGLVLNSKNKEHFEKYTDLEANYENIKIAFEKGVLISIDSIQSILKLEEREKQETNDRILSTRCIKGCDSNLKT